MSFTIEVIRKLSIEEKKNFVRYLKKKNRRGDVKNIELFHLLDQGKYAVAEELYTPVSKNAFHALNKRLFDSLIDFIAIVRFEEESSEEMEVMKYLVASRFLFDKELNKIAFRTLKKAEDKSIQYGLHTLLNEIFTYKIQKAHLDFSINLDEEIIKYKENKIKIDQEEKLNLFYASVKRDLNIVEIEVAEVVQKNLLKFELTIQNGLTYNSLLKILEISNSVAAMSRDYFSIMSFVETTCEKIEGLDNHSHKNLGSHIQLLYYLANFNFRCKNFSKSKSYLYTMQQCMMLEGKKYFEPFKLKYVLLHSLLQVFSGAVELAVKELSVVDFSKLKSDTVDLLDLKLTQIISLFLNGDIKESFNKYREFYHSDVWYAKKCGKVWVIQKNLIELLLLVELDNYDLFELRLSSFRKKHKTNIQNHKEDRVLEFLKLVVLYYKNPNITTNDSFRNRIETLITNNLVEEDIFIVSFYSWLKAKVVEKSVYEVCLESVSLK